MLDYRLGILLPKYVLIHHLRASGLVFLTFFLAVLSRPARAQLYSRPEARALAADLYAEKLLSKTGQEALEREIESGRLPLYTPRRIDFPDYGDSLSTGQLLGFLYRAYESAFLHRLGVGLQLEIVREWEQHPDFNPEMLRTTEFRRQVRSRLERLPGYWIERAASEAAHAQGLILQEGAGDARAFHGLGNTTYTDTLVPAGHSVGGYQVRETLDRLVEVGLITEDTLRNYSSNLDDLGLVPDHHLLRQLAQAYGLREARILRIAARSSAISRLAGQQMVDSTLVGKLLQDTAMLASPNADTLYVYLRPRLTISLPKPESPRALAAQLIQGLRRYDGRFDALVLDAEPTEESQSFLRYRWLARSGDTLVHATAGQYGFVGNSDDPWIYGYDLKALLESVNRFLDVSRAPYRLYYVEPGAVGNAEAPVAVDFFPLTSSAARTLSYLGDGDAIGRLSGPNPRGYLSPGEVTEIVDSLHRLTTGYSPSEAQLRAVEDCLQETTLEGLADLMRCVPDAGGVVQKPENAYEVLSERFEEEPLRIYLPGEVARFLLRRFPVAVRKLD